MTPERVLITGATGYIGRHLVAALHGGDYEFTLLAHKQREPFPGVQNAPLFADIRNYDEVQRAIKDCQTLVHLACSPLGKSFENPLMDFHTNMLGTANVLQAAAEAGVRQVVIASSAQVYGHAGLLPLSEDLPCAPLSPYATHKLCTETLAQSYARNYGLGVTVLRIFNVYGTTLPDIRRDTVEIRFVRKVLKHESPVIKANPLEARDFIHIRDIVRALRLAMAHTGRGEILNIGTGQLTTLQVLADQIIRLSGKQLSASIENGNKTAFQLQADVNRAREVLKFVASITLDEGLREMLAQEIKKVEWV